MFRNIDAVVLLVTFFSSATKARPQAMRSGSEDSPDPLLMKCLHEVKSACGPSFVSLTEEVSDDVDLADNIFVGSGLREDCRLMLDLQLCVDNTLSTVCSYSAQSTVQSMIAYYSAGINNALQLVCVRNIEQFENIETCINEKKLEGIDLKAINARTCDNSADSADATDLCSIRMELSCPLDILGKHCGQEAKEVVADLVERFTADIGCDADYFSDIRRDAESLIQLLLIA